MSSQPQPTAVQIAHIYQRTLRIVMFSQLLGGAGLAAGITVGALIAQDMLGTDQFAGLPAALFTLGSALAALLVANITQHWGRRFGLSFGFILGGIGALGIILATRLHSITLLLVALLVYGAGTATNLQARYAATDLALPKQRATAISMAMVATTFGAVLGPNMVGVMSQLAQSLNIPPLAGIFILAAAAFFSAGLLLLFLLTPDPYLLSKQLAQSTPINSLSPLTGAQTDNRALMIRGASVMVITQMVMVAIMTMTPIHMRHHGHSMSAVGLVIGVHIGAMYFPSLLTGLLVNRIGTTKMAIAAGITLLMAAVVTMLAPPESTGWLILGLALLGIGWNFGLISGTTTLVNATTPTSRPIIQGRTDVLIALAGAGGGLLAGMIVNFSSYGMLSLVGSLLSLALIVFILLQKHLMR